MPKTKREENVARQAEGSPVPVKEKKKKEKKSKKDKKKKSKEQVVETPVVETPVVETPVVETPVVETPVVEQKVEEKTSVDSASPSDLVAPVSVYQNTDNLLQGVIGRVQERIASDKTLLSSLKELTKQVTRERKETERVLKKANKVQKRKKNRGNRSPGGFTKPTPLSDGMCTFLEVPVGTELPRTDVTRQINKYVKENNLQNPENKKQILPDSKLTNLLFLKDGDELTYFNLQRYMTIHFLKRDETTGEVSPFVPPTRA